MSAFGSDLWNQIENVDHYASHRIDQMMDINEFFKSVAAAELEYSAQILKIAKPYRDHLAKEKEKIAKSNDVNLKNFGQISSQSAIVSTWEQILNDIEKASSLHFELSEILNVERKTLKGCAQQLQILNKQTFDKIKQSLGEVGRKVESMEKYHYTYDKDFTNLESTHLSLKKCLKEKKSEKDIDKARLDLEKNVTIMKQDLFFYKKAIDDTNSSKQTHYALTVPTALNELQLEHEQKGVEMTKSVLQQVTQAYVSRLPLELEVWKGLEGATMKIDARAESNLVANTFKDGDKPPLNFSFDDTQDILKKKLLLHNENIFLREDSEDLQNQQPKVGKKKAAERIKAIEKEMNEVEKKRQILKGIIQTFQELPNPYSTINEIQARKADLSQKMNTLLLKKHFFEEYICNVDGKPAPPYPTLIGADDPTDRLPESSTTQKSMKTPISAFASTPILLPEVEKTAPLDLHFSMDQAAKQPKAEVLQAIYDFTAGDSCELSLTAGSPVEIVEAGDDGWTKVRDVSSGREGLVPTSYIGK